MSENKNADPASLGLFGLAMVTLVGSSQKMGWTQGFAFIMPWAFFLGALAQFMAGILNYKKGNAFGGTAFCAYGLFWFASATAWLVNLGVLGQVLQSNADPRQLGFAFLGYLIITLFLTVGAMAANKVLFLIFVCIDLFFIGLSVSILASIPAVAGAFHQLAAYAELSIALLAFYGGGANLLNNHFGRSILPIGKPFGIKINR